MTCREIRLSDLIIPKYYSTFNTSEAHKIFTSGRAGTKSSRGGIKAVNSIVSDDNCSVVVIRKFHNKLKKTVFKEVLRAIARLGLDKSDFKITVSPMEVKYLPNGNTIYFTGNDSIDDTKGMIDEEKPIKLVQIDELTEFFDKGDGADELANIEATFIRGNDDLFTMEYYFNPPRNPKAPIMEWLNSMKKRPDCIHIHNDYRDVPIKWLGKKLVASALVLKTLDEKMYNWLWLGLCTGLDELIYYMFKDSMMHDFEKSDYSSCSFLGCGIDYGQMNATTFECFGLDIANKQLLGVDEFYHSGRESGHQKSPSDYAREFKKFRRQCEELTGKKLIYVYIDPSAAGLKEEIQRLCPDISYIGADNTVIKGINRVQKIMTFDIVKFSKRQEHLKKEMSLYEWNKDLLDKGKEVPVKENDHCQDGFRYLVMGLWKYIKMFLPKAEREE